MSTTIPRLSIGLPVYNGARYLSGAIESLLGQSFTDFELIISDNASTDATEAICRAYAAQDARIRYIRQPENLGAARNFNRVYELARAELFSWAAADDVRQETYYARCLQLLDQRPEVLWCHSLSSHMGPDGKILPQTALQGVSYLTVGNVSGRDAETPAQRLAGVLLGTGGCLDSYGVIRSAALRSTSMILPYFGSEKVLIAELALAGRYAEVPEELFMMRIHDAAMGATQTGEDQQAVFAPQTTPRWIRWKLLAAYFQAISRASLSLPERVRCYLVLAHYLLQIKKWPDLLRKAVRGAGIGGDNAKMLRGLTMSSSAQPATAPPQCPGCLARQTIEFHRVRQAPVSVGTIYDTPAAARQAAVGEMRLYYCQSCQLVWNALFDLAQVPFRPGYEVGLNHSAKFRDFLQQVASRLSDRYQLAGKTVLEIGCGAGYFLRLLCAQAKCHGVGIDPTVPQPGEVSSGGQQIRFIQDYFSEKYAALPCDFVCCLSVFEAVPQPLAFLKNLRGLLAGREQLDMYFEVFNAHRAFEALETFSPHYEQCNYFGVDSLAHVFSRAGLEVLEQGTCYGAGQYAYVEARLGPQASTTPLPAPAEVPPLIANFTRAHQERLQLWKSRLEQFRAERTRVALWGSGGKGISFLNQLQIHQEIEFVVDINQDRQGHYLPVTAQQIVPPQFLTDYQPEVVIVTNPLYEQEIRSQCESLGIQTRFVPL